MILGLLDFPIKAARIHLKKYVELMSIMSKFLCFKFSAHLITNARSLLVSINYKDRKDPF